ncbi:MAG: hypothetical protein IJ048_03300, partial [Clostridia bacterium]|nr:hypothetical protein [Clostridia bacterium]
APRRFDRSERGERPAWEGRTRQRDERPYARERRPYAPQSAAPSKQRRDFPAKSRRYGRETAK